MSASGAVGDDAIEHVAETCGFRDAAALRTHFKRIVGTTPTGYRARFGSSPRPNVE
jgi:transcriptional regulator GlxA family with amidase domain